MALSLSPDGTRVAFIAPVKGHGAQLVTGTVEPELRGKPIMFSDGKPFRLQGCRWVSNDRLVCQVYGIVRDTSRTTELMPISRWFAVNADGATCRLLAVQRTINSRGYFSAMAKSSTTFRMRTARF